MTTSQNDDDNFAFPRSVSLEGHVPASTMVANPSNERLFSVLSNDDNAFEVQVLQDLPRQADTALLGCASPPPALPEVGRPIEIKRLGLAIPDMSTFLDDCLAALGTRHTGPPPGTPPKAPDSPPTDSFSAFSDSIPQSALQEVAQDDEYIKGSRVKRNQVASLPSPAGSGTASPPSELAYMNRDSLEE